MKSNNLIFIIILIIMLIMQYCSTNSENVKADKKQNTNQNALSSTQENEYPLRFQSYFIGGIGIASLSYGIFQCTKMVSLINESNDLEDEYFALTENNPEIDFVEKQNEINSKRDDARNYENQTYIFGTAGLVLIGSAIYFFLYEEEAPVNMKVSTNYSEIDFSIRF